MLDDVSTVSGLLGIDPYMDSVELDEFLLATADDFLEPFADATISPDSSLFAATQDLLYEKDQDLNMLRAAGFDVPVNGETSSLVDDQVESLRERQEKIPMLPTTTMGASGYLNCKRKTLELDKCCDEADKCMGKKTKRQEERVVVKNERNTTEHMESMYRRRYDLLYGILEAWNTGGIEDLEEIADNVYDDDVTLISPDSSDGLHGVDAVLSHWGLLLDAFPDGMMEDYIIQRDESSTEQMKATWTFSGTQVFPIFGIEPRHKKVCISGKSLFVFKGDRIRQIILSWNYSETLLKLMGVQPEETDSRVLHASASTTTSHCKVSQ